MSELINQENNAHNYQEMVREDIVQTAVKFLQNSNVVNTPLAQKQIFLQRKGLSDQEIQIACERSGAYAVHENQPPNIPPPVVVRTNRQLQSISVFDRFKEIVHAIGLFSAVAYAIYLFYKKVIRPYLFGGKKKSLEDSIDDLSKSVTSSLDELKENLTTVKIEIDRINQDIETSTQRQLKDLKSEICTVKGLLLSRKQFPSVSNVPVEPPSIPAWQLSSVQQDQDNDGADAKSEDLMEIGSGSSSSEHEQGTKNSESSLEIM